MIESLEPTTCANCSGDIWDNPMHHCRCLGVASEPLCPCKAPRDAYNDVNYRPTEHGWVEGWDHESYTKTVNGKTYEIWWNPHGAGINIDNRMQSLEVEGPYGDCISNVCWEIDHGFGLGSTK